MAYVGGPDLWNLPDLLSRLTETIAQPSRNHRREDDKVEKLSSVLALVKTPL